MTVKQEGLSKQKQLRKKVEHGKNAYHEKGNTSVRDRDKKDRVRC